MKTPQTLEAIIKEHSERLHCYHCGSDEERVAHIIRDYHDSAVGALDQAKHFRDDLQTYLRALALVLDMTANASTHGEKNARLRGGLELLEGAIGKLREQDFDFTMRYRTFSVDLFRSDYPTRHLMDRIHELERELKEAKASQQPDAESASA